MSLIPKLEDGWEIALLAASSNGRVEGLVWANKALARLQREGFPIPLVFRNIQMGPASLELLPRARRAEDRGILEVQNVPLKAQGLDDRTDFALTPEGSKYVQTVVLPAMKQHPRSALLYRSFRRAIDDCAHTPTKALVREAHDALYLDDRPKLLGAYLSTSQALHERLDATVAAGRPRDMFAITLGATLELSCQALDAVKPAIEDPEDKSTGKNHILAKSEDFVDLLAQLDRLAPLKLAKEIQEDVELILNALEVNCAVYGLVDLFSDEDVARMLAEVPPLDLQRGHD